MQLAWIKDMIMNHTPKNKERGHDYVSKTRMPFLLAIYIIGVAREHLTH
jgi:hypothetical protein